MKALILSLILTLAFGTVVNVEAQTVRQVRMRVGTEKKVARTDLRIKFAKFIEDSRCPTDVDCVWAGNAKIQIKVTGKRGTSKTFEINTNLQPQAVTFDGYEIKLIELTPKPASNIRINPNGYTASFEVKRL